MKRKVTVPTLCAMLVVLSVHAAAQQPKKVPRIGYLVFTSYSVASHRIKAFQRGLRELGHVEGKNGFRLHSLGA